MPPDFRHARLVTGLAVSEIIASNPGMFKHVFVHVSVINMKSILEIESIKSLFLVLSPRTLLNIPLIFQVLNEIPVLILDISNNLIENAGSNSFGGKNPNLLFNSKIMHDRI